MRVRSRFIERDTNCIDSVGCLRRWEALGRSMYHGQKVVCLRW